MWRSAAPVTSLPGRSRELAFARRIPPTLPPQGAASMKAMARIDPQLLKAMFSRGDLDEKSAAKTKTLSDQELGGCIELPLPTSLPSLKNPIETKEQGKGTPMTIFFNGGVSTFKVSPDKAEKIIKLAQEFNIRRVDSTSPIDPSVSNVCSSSEGGEAPKGAFFARRNSLTTFLEKRRDRLTSSSPYTLRRPDKGVVQLAMSTSFPDLWN